MLSITKLDKCTIFHMHAYIAIDLRKGVLDELNGNWNLYDPYVYEALTRMQNQNIAVQTIRGSVRGELRMVAPDHVVVMMGGTPFYIRTEQIIWFHPLKA